MLRNRNRTNLKKTPITLILFGALLVVLGISATAHAQEGNMYEEPWHPASRFAVKEASAKNKVTITLVKINDANFTTGEAGLDFNMCLAVKYKSKKKNPQTRYVLTNVFRDDKSMVYRLNSWVLKKDANCSN